MLIIKTIKLYLKVPSIIFCLYLYETKQPNKNVMKAISKNERPIGKGYTGYTSFYSENIVNETEKAFLVSLYFDIIGETVNRWLPKSKMLCYNHIDERDLVYNGSEYVKNPNYGKDRNQYFISSYFTQDKSSMPTVAMLSKQYNEYVNMASENSILGVKGIDY